MPDPTCLRILYVRSRPLLQYAKPDGDGKLVACEPNEKGAVAMPVPPLDTRLELDQIVQALEDAGASVTLHILPHATGAAFARELNKTPPYDVVHFDGHGNTGVLCFEKPDGELHSINAKQLARLFEQGKTRMVFLSACLSRSVAESLRRAQVPAVMAMKKSVRPDAAAIFVGEFYARLAEGDTLQQAYAKAGSAVSVMPGKAAKQCNIPLLLAEDPGVKLTAETASAGLKLEHNPSATNIPPAAHGIFRGREANMVGIISDIIAGARLLTLKGGPGIGKTRMAEELGRWMAERRLFPDGVLMARLSSKAAVSTIAEAVALDLGLKQRGKGPSQALKELCGTGKLLLIIDNLETFLDQRADASAALVGDLLSACPDLTIMTTSREPLHLSGWEQVRDVEALDPAPAVRVFDDYGNAVCGRAIIQSREDLATVSEICDLLGRTPLFVELAASHLAEMSLRELHVELKKRKLTLLKTERKGVEARLADAGLSLGFSFDRLSPEERLLFAKMSVFEDGAFESSIQGVCETENLKPQLTRLCALSLVERAELGDHSRYSLQPVIREYAEERVPVSERTGLHRRFAQRFLDLARYGASRFGTSEANVIAGITAMELANMLAGQKWSVTNVAHELTVEYAYALLPVLYQTGYWTEAQRAVSDGIAAATARNDKTNVLSLKGNLALILQQLGEPTEAGKLYQEVEEDMSALPPKERANHYLNRGIVLHRQGDIAEARRLYDLSLAINKELGDKSGIATALAQLAQVAGLMGDIEVATRLNEESLDIRRAIGDKAGLTQNLHELAIIRQCQGDHAEARKLHNQSLAFRKELGDRPGIAVTLHQLGTLAQTQGDYAEARRLYCQSLVISQELGTKAGIAETTAQFGSLAEAEGDDRTALRNYLIAFSIFSELKRPERDMIGAWVVQMRQRLGGEAFKKLYDEVTSEPKPA